MKALLISAFGAMLLAWSAPGAGNPPAYAVVVSAATWADPGWRLVTETLREKHLARVLHYTNSVAEVLPGLRQEHPRYLCIVAPPQEATRALVAQAYQLCRQIDADPYPDCQWGILTGYDATNALRIARQREPLTVRRVASGTPIPLERCEAGQWFSELEAGRRMEKAPGRTPTESKGSADSTLDLVRSLTEYRAEAFITSGHATERDWQIGYRYRNGYFKCAGGRLYGEDTRGEKHPVESPNPKVYLPVGNCLMGHIDGTNAMALAFLNSGGVVQMMGYTVPTWYGYAGWGCLDYFLEQPGRFTLAETFLANSAALIHRLDTHFPELTRAPFDPDRMQRPKIQVTESARAAGLTAQDGYGLLHDRDVVAFYGDPAWAARLADGPLDWEQTLVEREGVWTFRVAAKHEKAFDTVDRNGSQRGGRPVFALLPRRIGPAEVLGGADLKPVITDDFILLPNPGTAASNRVYQITFRARAL